MAKLFNIFFCFAVVVFFSISSTAQQNFYQETCKCGVSGAGFSAALGSGSGQIDVHIESGSIIKKAFLFVIKYGEASDTILKLNDAEIDPKNEIFSFVTSGNVSAPNISINAIDVSNIVTPSLTNYTIEIPFQNSCLGCSYNCVYLYVLYENQSFTENITSYIFINDINDNFNVDYQSSNLNPIFNSSPIGFANYLDRMNDNIIQQDGSYLLFNDGSIWNNVGLMKGSDAINSMWDGAGVKGHFYFQNNTLFGLDDDTPDNIVGGTDGLLDASQYLLPDNTLKWRLQWETNQPKYNIYGGFFISHSTTCDTFSVSTPNDTTLCQGETLQLSATGGQAYEWLPSTGLSCSDCPNPIFTADSSMFYTVRIRNNDSCSVVRPLKINVRPRPVFGTIASTTSECGANTGTATLNAFPNNSIVTNWQEVGGATQTSNVFQNLSTGNHTFFFVDTNGCQSADTTFFVGEINTTSASFSVSPQSGAVPLTVQFTNTSLNATNFEWFLEDVSMGGSFPNYEFSTSGTFEIMLVAWQNDPTCADTAIQTVVIYDSLMISVPNVFTPNGDGVNDFYTLTASQDVSYELIILNRWGNEILIDNGSLLLGVSKNVWDGGNSPDGVYFVKLKIVSESGEIIEVEDFVTVVK